MGLGLMSLGLLRGERTLDMKKVVEEVAACPIKRENVRKTILGVARGMMLEEIGRRRLSSSVKRK
jgi:hypothetical protein